MNTETIYILEEDGTLYLYDYKPASYYDYDYVLEEASYHVKNGILSIKGNKVNFDKSVYYKDLSDEDLGNYELNSNYIEGTVTKETYTKLTWKGFKKHTVNESTTGVLELKVRTPLNIQTSVFVIKKQKVISL